MNTVQLQRVRHYPSGINRYKSASVSIRLKYQTNSSNNAAKVVASRTKRFNSICWKIYLVPCRCNIVSTYNVPNKAYYLCHDYLHRYNHLSSRLYSAQSTQYHLLREIAILHTRYTQGFSVTTEQR